MFERGTSRQPRSRSSASAPAPPGTAGHEGSESASAYSSSAELEALALREEHERLPQHLAVGQTPSSSTRGSISW